MDRISHQIGLRSRVFINYFCTFLMISVLSCTLAFADEQNYYSLDKAFDIIDKITEKLLQGNGLSNEEHSAIGILDRAQQKQEKPEKGLASISFQEKNHGRKTRYKPIKGTRSALGIVMEDDSFCEQKLYDNGDDLTFTYLRRTKDGYTEKWVFLKNANPFYWAHCWDDIGKKLDELDEIEDQGIYQLPPSKVLIEIVNLAKICPFEVSSITGTDIDIFNTAKVVPYWANEEYFYTDSKTTQHAATVSLFYAKRGHQNKKSFAIIWPCYLKSRDKNRVLSSNNKLN